MRNYLIQVFISVDQLVNTVAAPLLNLMMSKQSYKFGHPDETLSGVMGKNVRGGHCRFCKFICRLLHKADPNHCKDAIEDEL